MKFEMNGAKWEIKEVNQEDFDGYSKNQEGSYFGQSHFALQEVWLWKDITPEKKRKTLIHELTHVYLQSYITHEDMNFTEEILCDISANSHDIIHKIVRDYFNNIGD